MGSELKTNVGSLSLLPSRQPEPERDGGDWWSTHSSNNMEIGTIIILIFLITSYKEVPPPI